MVFKQQQFLRTCSQEKIVAHLNHMSRISLRAVIGYELQEIERKISASSTIRVVTWETTAKPLDQKAVIKLEDETV